MPQMELLEDTLLERHGGAGQTLLQIARAIAKLA